MGTRHKVLWNDERDKIITDNRGTLSASVIAEMIGGGCTRCSVIGRSRRLGLVALTKNDPEKTIRRRSSYLIKPRGPITLRVAKPRALPVPPIIDAQIPFEQRKQLFDLECGDCRWPVGHPGTPGFFFCGGKIISESPYCPAHHKRAHNNDQPRGVATSFRFRRAA